MSTPQTSAKSPVLTQGAMEAAARRAYRIMTHPFTGLSTAVSGSITNSAIKNIQSAVSNELDDVKKFVMDGHMSWQVLGFIAGLLMFAGGLYNLLYDALGLMVKYTFSLVNFIV